MKKGGQILDKSEEILAVILFSLMSIIILWAVICRFILKIPFSWGEESARYLMIWGIFIGISIGVRTNAHLGVEAFVELLPKRMHRYVEAFSEVLCFAIYVILFILSMQLIVVMYSKGQTSAAMHIPMWWAYLAMPVGLFLSCVRTLNVFYSNYIKKKDKPEPGEGEAG